MAAPQLDDLDQGFLEVELASGVVPLQAIPPPRMPQDELGPMFAELAAYQVDKPARRERDGFGVDPCRSRPGEASWYDLEDRSAYLRARAPQDRRLATDFTWERWGRMLQAFGWQCAYCRGVEELEQDHVVPIHKGGDDRMGNILPACHACNEHKGHKTLTTWLLQKGREFGQLALAAISRGREEYARLERGIR